MTVPIPVIPVGRLLGHHLGFRQGEDNLTRVLGMGGEEGLHRIEGLAHIPGTAAGHVLRHPSLPVHLRPPGLGQGADAPLHHGQHLLRGQGFKLKHRGPAENRIVDVEVGILCGGGNESQFPILHKLQQGLLLFLVEVLNLIQIQHHPFRGQQCAHIGGDGLDIRQRRRGGIEAVERPVNAGGGNLRHGGLSGAGGAVEDQVGDGSPLDDPPQHAPLPQDMPLPGHFVQGFGAKLVCQRLVHGLPPFDQKWNREDDRMPSSLFYQQKVPV